jgi:replicative DNA helicase Mcm
MDGVSDNPFVSRWELFFKTVCLKDIQRLAEKFPERRSLEIDFRQIEHFDFELADELLVNPDVVLEAARVAVGEIDVPVLESRHEFCPHVRVFNLPKDFSPALRNISASHIGRLISAEGVVKQLTDVLPKLEVAEWECRYCGNKYKVIQSGQKEERPLMCECKHRDFVLVSKNSKFTDYQKIQIQEPLELMKGSEQATNIDIYVSDDLVNKVAPGNRTRFTGVMRLVPPKEKKTVFGRYLEAVHVEETEKDYEDVEISQEEEVQIKEFAQNPQIYELLVKSIAPAIYGHETVKESIALQLFGGVEKNLPNNQRIRGNIHVLLVGDPGMAKSQILQAANNIAPKSIYVAGKTTTGAGITASAVKDEFGEGGWTLRAGALVLASGGAAFIDEFDKMESEDRSALHEAMEQGKISIAKAGIVTQFKTNTTILAAANPKYARFDPYQPFIDQINLPPTLISRFDLFFMLRDVLDRKKDEEISNHILQTHRAGELMLQKVKKRGKEKEELEELKEKITPAISSELLKKYIAYARQNVFPVMTQKAIEDINRFYIDLRDQGRKEGSFTATHRQLEGIVRLSEASARVRLSNVVEPEDTDRAIRILKNSLQDLVTDPETGKVDIDIITSGQTHSAMTNLKTVLGIIRSKAQEMDMVPIEDVVNEAKTEGIESDKVREIITKLDRAGDIYKPRHGFVKPSKK